MKKAASVFLRTNITVDDAYKLIEWLENKEITKYLNESPEATDEIRTVVASLNTHLLTYHFNRYGRFFMIDTDSGNTIGFIRLAEMKIDNAYEIVIVIGDKTKWGQGYGRNALKKCLQILFFDLRADMLLANIHVENIHSIHLFEKSGLYREKENRNTVRYKISKHEFLK